MKEYSSEVLRNHNSMIVDLNKPNIQREIERTRKMRKYWTAQLKIKYDEIAALDDPSVALKELDEYQVINEKLRLCKITEAELVYLRNMI